MIDLLKFNYPDVTVVDIAFPTFDAIPELLVEAKERGFYLGQTPFNKMFSTLFFTGGSVKFKKDIPPDFKEKAWAYVRAFIGSWAPKHEEKEAICAMLLSELVEAVDKRPLKERNAKV